MNFGMSRNHPGVIAPIPNVAIASFLFLITLAWGGSAFGQTVQLKPATPVPAKPGELAPVAPPSTPQTPEAKQPSLGDTGKPAKPSEGAEAKRPTEYEVQVRDEEYRAKVDQQRKESFDRIMRSSGLSEEVIATVKKAGIHTLSELRAKRSELKKLPNVAQATLEGVQQNWPPSIEPAYPENYLTFRYPQKPSAEYRDKVLGLPPHTQGGIPVERPFTPWLSQKLLAQAYEYYSLGNVNLAMSSLGDASLVIERDWRYWVWATSQNSGSQDCKLQDFLVQKLKERERLPLSGSDLLDALSRDLSSLDSTPFDGLTQDQRFSEGSLSGIASWCVGDVVRERPFPYYYMRMFTIPLLSSALLADAGNFSGALASLSEVHSEPTFFEVSAHKDLEGYQPYGAVSGSAILANEIPKKRSFYGHCMYADEMTGKCDVLPGGGATPHPVEIQVIRLKVAAVYVAWAEALYRRGEYGNAATKYRQVLRIFYPVWKSAVQADTPAFVSGNPEIVRVVLAADVGLRKLGAGLNVLGFPENYVPGWGYAYLRQQAQYVIGLAKALERDALSFLSNAEQQAEQNLLLEQSIGLAQQTLAFEESKAAAARMSVEIASENARLASTRAENQKANLKDFQTLHPFAKGIELSKGYGYFAEGASMVPAGLGGQPMRLGEQQNEARAMARSLVELRILEGVASMEVAKAGLDWRIAQMGAAIAQLDLANKEEHLRFARNRTLSSEFWGELSRDVRKKSHRYLDYGVNLAWLTEQAYEFEEQSTVDVVRMDYLSSDKWLAADQLLLDLDTIEYRRLMERRRKASTVSYTMSIRDKSLIEFQRFKETGHLVFNVTEEELDIRFPGTYNRRIDKVEVSVMALVGPEGVSGTLTKYAYSLVRVPAPANPTVNETERDWLAYTPTGFVLRPSNTLQETLVFSTESANSDRLTYSSRVSDGQKGIFEDHAISGTWRLEFPRYANTFDYASLFDVLIVIHFRTNFDEGLKKAIETERRKLLATKEIAPAGVVAYSASANLPDEMYSFHNPPTGNESAKKHRFISVAVSREHFLSYEQDQKLREIWFAFRSGGRAIPIVASITSRSLNPTARIEMVGGQLEIKSGAGSLSQLRWFPAPSAGESWSAIPTTQVGGKPVVYMTSGLAEKARLLDLWVLRIDADKNPELCLPGTSEFDPSRLATITDVILEFRYDYQFPGLLGLAIITWAHFQEKSSPPTMYSTAVPGLRVAWSGFDTEHWRVEEGAGTLRHIQDTRSSLLTPREVDVFPPSRKFDLSLRVRKVANATGNEAAEVEIVGGLEHVFRMSLSKLANNTPEGHTHQIVIARRKGDQWQRLCQLTAKADMARGETLQIIGVRIEGNSVLRWEFGSKTACEFKEAGLFDARMLNIGAEGPVEFDDLLIADHTRE